MSNEKQREPKAWRKENGRCTNCGRKLPEGYTFVTCEKCRASHRAYCQFRKENRLCIKCGVKLPDGYMFATCENCKKYRNSYYALLKKEQLCVYCGKQDAYTLNKHALCAECAERANENHRKRRAQSPQLAERKSVRSKELYNSRKEQELCAKCGKSLPESDHHVFCPVCRARYRRYNERAAEKRNGPGRLTRQNVSEFGICSMCFKAPAERGKLCEKCYEALLHNLGKAREALAEKNADHPWRAAENARLEEEKKVWPGRKTT